MKEIQFNNKKYKIPTDWDEITLEMQMQVSRVSALQKHVKMIGIIAGYCGIPVDELKVAKINKIYDLMKSLIFMKIDIPINKKLEWEFEGFNYKVDKNLGDMQFQDFVSIQTILAENQDTYYDALPILVAVICKREGETLDDYDLIERSKIMKKMPISVASSIASFFLFRENYSKLLTHLSLPHVQQNILLGKLNELKTTQNPLDQRHGGKWLTRLLLGILRRYTKFLEKILMKYFNTIQSKSSTTNWMQTFKKLVMKKLKRNKK